VIDPKKKGLPYYWEDFREYKNSIYMAQRKQKREGEERRGGADISRWPESEKKTLFLGGKGNVFYLKEKKGGVLSAYLRKEKGQRKEERKVKL